MYNIFIKISICQFTEITLMANPIYSFSVKTEEERAFIAAIKKECRLTGTSFSHVVIEALKARYVKQGAQTNG
jgi:hypothetical protein